MTSEPDEMPTGAATSLAVLDVPVNPHEST